MESNEQDLSFCFNCWRRRTDIGFKVGGPKSSSYLWVEHGDNNFIVGHFKDEKNCL